MIVMRCKYNISGFIKGYKVQERNVDKVAYNDEKYFKRDTYVSDFVFANCYDIVELMRKGEG